LLKWSASRLGNPLIPALVLLFLASIPLAQATTTYSIPANGHFSTLTIGIQIPQNPAWAHDVAVNATRAWNQAQKWYQMNVQQGSPYVFLESSTGQVLLSFTLPTAYSKFAIAWTEYTYAPSSKTRIVGAHVYLSQTIFNQAQESNSTARQYAFRLVLHELGHVLGLGHVLDGKDIMDPRGPAYLSTQQPFISTLDLYAIHTLASTTSVPTFITLPSNITYQLMDARTFLSG
jgi:hypothetical protein